MKNILVATFLAILLISCNHSVQALKEKQSVAQIDKDTVKPVIGEFVLPLSYTRASVTEFIISEKITKTLEGTIKGNLENARGALNMHIKI